MCHQQRLVPSLLAAPLPFLLSSPTVGFFCSLFQGVAALLVFYGGLLIFWGCDFALNADVPPRHCQKQSGL